MNRVKESLKLALSLAESYLEKKSKRELILLFIFCFLVGFLAVFSATFERAKESLEAKNQTKMNLKHQLLELQRVFEANKTLDNTKDLEDWIHDLEQKISMQERQKNLLQNQSSIYALRQIADSKGLQDFMLEQENQRILLYAKGKYKNFSALLEQLESQQHLEIYHLNLYPNALTQDLEFYLGVDRRQSGEIPNSQGSLE
ncbi:hypothetical protein [Helicobacter sp. MIT 05-5294]|uniref:hypothetical protein n=1 Tax=Helicobacter sp. MIT 05-5294 TaxID=1548150 RepID=UPI00051FA5A5|nr:hypothetical protein [Helicobacter sp. MIT 05-5294]TLD85957.1 hypothetical protein LS69_007260 [Helicobacter sp. MIT 05-5294]